MDKVLFFVALVVLNVGFATSALAQTKVIYGEATAKVSRCGEVEKKFLWHKYKGEECSNDVALAQALERAKADAIKQCETWAQREGKAFGQILPDSWKGAWGGWRRIEKKYALREQHISGSCVAMDTDPRAAEGEKAAPEQAQPESNESAAASAAN